MFYFLISLSKNSPLNIKEIKNFFITFSGEGAKFFDYIFWDINPKELTWDRYYNGEELVEVSLGEENLENIIELLDKKYLSGFTMSIDSFPKLKVIISPYDDSSYEISFSIDSEFLDIKYENTIKLITKRLIEIFEPKLLVSGIEESVLTIDENNIYDSNNVYEFYTSNLNFSEKIKKFDSYLLKDGILFINRDFFKNLLK